MTSIVFVSAHLFITHLCILLAFRQTKYPLQMIRTADAVHFNVSTLLTL